MFNYWQVNNNEMCTSPLWGPQINKTKFTHKVGIPRKKAGKKINFSHLFILLTTLRLSKIVNKVETCTRLQTNDRSHVVTNMRLILHAQLAN